MSIFMTVVGTWICSRNVSIEPIRTFFYKWPRNFAISFAIEDLVGFESIVVGLLEKFKSMTSMQGLKHLITEVLK
ncbi:MAG TPA: hypothetical protein VFW58_12005 [Trichococcus sp.]|nr:hypothetical protein [Trichococcus sp.]